MVTQATKELFTLINVLCGGLVLLGLAFYWLRGRPRRGAVLALLLVTVFICLLNALTVYFVL